ncbi:MAG: RNA methyltransferase [Bacteroidetes bacterium]|nr:MAG: RNA methyltransferase [Bacteroidota bacterium]
MPKKITQKRLARLREVVERRQLDFTVVLENVHDPHNISAVMRSCEAVGMAEIYVLHTEAQLQERYLELGHKSSAGTRKWLDVRYFTDLEACVKAVRTRYAKIYATHLATHALSLYELDLTQSVALWFGNEHAGVSEAALAHADGNFLIPQMGMVQSLNISVACAVSVYEGLRQRQAKGFYGAHNPAVPQQQQALLADYVRRHEHGLTGKKVWAQGTKQPE